jgi:hypothetical protein
MKRTARNTVGLLADLAIGAFGLVLLARGFAIAAALLLIVAGADLLIRLGLLPFARRGSLSARQRGDLLWGTVLTVVGSAILIEELVVVIEGGRGGRHLAAVAIGAFAVVAALVCFGRLLRSRR